MSPDCRTLKNKVSPHVATFHALSASNTKDRLSKPPAAKKREQVKTRQRRNPAPLPLHPKKKEKKEVSFPPPQSGMQYTKKEIVELCLPLLGKERSHQIDELIEEKLVPVQRSTLYRILKKAQDNGEFPGPDEPWEYKRTCFP